MPIARRPAPPQGRTYSVTLANTAASIPLAARTTRTVFTTWGVPGRASTLDAAQLIVTELIANTVRHTRCRRITVTFTVNSKHLGIAVHDRDPRLPTLPAPGPAPAGAGHGLAVVAEVADDFGGDLATTTDPAQATGKTIQVLLARPAP